MMVSVVARTDFKYEGRAIHRGEAVEMSPVDAAVHGRQKLVSLSRGARPTYQTRDMVPEPPSLTVMVEIPPQPDPVVDIPVYNIEPIPEPPKRRRGRPRKQTL